MQQDKQIPKEERGQLLVQAGKHLISSLHDNAMWVHDFFFFAFWLKEMKNTIQV